MFLMCNQSLNYIFYLEFLVHVSLVKKDISTEEFCNLDVGLRGDSHYGLHPLFHIWVNFKTYETIQG